MSSPFYQRALAYMRLVWYVWSACALAYAANTFLVRQVEGELAAALFALVSVVCLMTCTCIALLSRRSWYRAQELAAPIQQRQREQAIDEMGRQKLLDLSALCLERQAEQGRVRELWGVHEHRKSLMAAIFQMRARSWADALNCARLRMLISAHPAAAEELDPLALRLQEAFMLMSLWAPGDQMEEMLPDMDELAPLTQRLTRPMNESAPTATSAD